MSAVRFCPWPHSPPFLEFNLCFRVCRKWRSRPNASRLCVVQTSHKGKPLALERGLPVRSALGQACRLQLPDGIRSGTVNLLFSLSNIIGVMTIFSGLALLRVAIVHTRVARANSSNFVAANNRASAGSRINATLRSLSDCGPIFSLLFSIGKWLRGSLRGTRLFPWRLFPMAFLRNRNSAPVRGPCS